MAIFFQINLLLFILFKLGCIHLSSPTSLTAQKTHTMISSNTRKMTRFNQNCSVAIKSGSRASMPAHSPHKRPVLRAIYRFHADCYHHRQNGHRLEHTGYSLLHESARLCVWHDGVPGGHDNDPLWDDTSPEGQEPISPQQLLNHSLQHLE